MPPLSRAKKKSLNELLNAKQNLVCAIHPILLQGSANSPVLNFQLCHQIVSAATTLENAFHIARNYVSDPQVIECFRLSENAVATIRQKLIKWCDGDEFPCQLNVLLSAILPPNIMQTDDFIAIAEDALMNTDISDAMRHPVESGINHSDPFAMNSQARSPSVSSTSSERTVIANFQQNTGALFNSAVNPDNVCQRAGLQHADMGVNAHLNSPVQAYSQYGVHTDLGSVSDHNITHSPLPSHVHVSIESRGASIDSRHLPQFYATPSYQPSDQHATLDKSITSHRYIPDSYVHNQEDLCSLNESSAAEEKSAFSPSQLLISPSNPFSDCNLQSSNSILFSSNPFHTHSMGKDSRGDNAVPPPEHSPVEYHNSTFLQSPSAPSYNKGDPPGSYLHPFQVKTEVADDTLRSLPPSNPFSSCKGSVAAPRDNVIPLHGSVPTQYCPPHLLSQSAVMCAKGEVNHPDSSMSVANPFTPNSPHTVVNKERNLMGVSNSAANPRSSFPSSMHTPVTVLENKQPCGTVGQELPMSASGNRVRSSAPQCLREFPIRTTSSEELMREQIMIEEGIRELKMQQVNEEAELELEVQKRRLQYEEQQKVFERRRRELAVKCEEYAASQIEGSVVFDGSYGNSLSCQLGYPQTSNEAAQNFRLQSSHGKANKENICYPNVGNDLKGLASEQNTYIIERNSIGKRPVFNLSAAKGDQTQPAANTTLTADHQNVQTQLLRNLENMVTESKMPNLSVQKFDGTPAKYTSFMRSFDDLISSRINNPTRLLAHLIDCCEGEALEKVEGLTILEPSEGYKEARAVLKLHYGQPHIIARSMLDDLLNSDSIEKDRSVPLGKKLLNFSSRIQTVHNTMKAISAFADVNSFSTISQLVAKLPAFGVNAWKKFAASIYRENREPNLVDFIKFVKDLAERESHAYSNILTLKQKQNRQREPLSNQGSGVSAKRMMATVGDEVSKRASKQSHSQRVSCTYCSESHFVERCPKFKGLKLSDRMNFAQKELLCFNCLRKGHVTTDCKFDPNCPIDQCNKKHHGLFHHMDSHEVPASHVIPGEEEGEDVAEEHHINCEVSTTPTGAGTQLSASTGAGIEASASTGAGVNLVSSSDTEVSASEPIYHIDFRPNKVSLGILPVVITAEGSSERFIAYAFLDDGSTAVVFLEELLDKLNVTGTAARLRSTTIHGVSVDPCRKQNFRIEALDGSDYVECTGFSRKTIDVGERNIPTTEQLQQYSHLKDINYPVLDNKQVYILIGSNVPEAHWVFNSRRGQRKQPFAVRGPLGWTVKGPLGKNRDLDNNINFIQTDFLQPEENIPCAIERMIKLDFNEHDNRSVCMSVEDKLALHKIKTSTIRTENGHFQVETPFKDGGEQVLNSHVKEAYQGALKRLHWLRKRFLRDSLLFQRYKEEILKLKNIPSVRIIPGNEVDHNDGWFLPHHPAFHPHKPDKVRVVLDCAAKFGGTSLNDQLLQSPDLNNSLIGVNLRFRQEAHAVVADVQGMFHQISLPPGQRKYFRILWFADDDINGEIIELEFLVHVFGAKPSPCVATHTLRVAAEEWRKDGGEEQVVETVTKDFYVDDMAASRPVTDDHKHCIDLVTNVPRALEASGFHLTKYASNCGHALAVVPSHERASSVAEVDMHSLDGSSDCNIIERTLGEFWDITKDELCCRVVKPSGLPCKRNVLSTVSKVFNPNGLASPFVLPGRRIYQSLTIEGFGWDQMMDESYLKKWNSWVDDLAQLEHLRIPRCYKPPDFGEVASVQLHMFADGALTLGYGAVGYLRYTSKEGKVHCSFVMAKSRVVPVKPVTTTPRLELVACALAAKLAKLIIDELSIEITSVVYWTDSTTVLQYIRDSTKRHPIFEGNRVQLIHGLTLVSCWRYVPTEVNPADIASRGLRMCQKDLVHIWCNAPKFLWGDESDFPVEPAKLLQSPSHMSDERFQEVAAICLAQEAAGEEPLVMQIMLKISSWRRLQKMVAWWLRLVNVYKNAVVSPVIFKQPLTTQDIQCATIVIARIVQQSEFPDEYKRYHTAVSQTNNFAVDVLSKTSLLSKHHPIMFPSDQVLRLNTRMRHAFHLSFDAKYPIIMPSNHHITRLLIVHYHLIVIHMGAGSVISAISEKYLIIGGNRYVKKVIGNCFKCKVRNQAPETQIMAPLPEFRVTAGGYAFEFTGLDYFGHFLVKRGRATVKRWGCLFTCLKTRAVHIEVAHSLDTDSFLCAFFRFVSRRGPPAELFSDNGTNFVGATENVTAALKRWNHGKIHSKLLDKGTNWHFNPPDCSHAGGVWERMIRTVRQILFHLANEQSLDDETLVTFFCEAEKVINDRPIVKGSCESDELHSLSPNDLLLGRRNPSFSPDDASTKDIYNARWKQSNYLAGVFWKRWLKEYLPLLRLRQKWHKPRRNILVGDLVLLVERSPRGQWPMAIVDKVFPGSDGVVRQVLVRTSTSSYMRDVRKLCLLEGSE